MKSLKHEHLFYLHSYMSNQHTLSLQLHRRVQRKGGAGGPDPPLFPGPPPFSSVTPPSTQPDLTDKCNVNCFLIVCYAV